MKRSLLQSVAITVIAASASLAVPTTTDAQNAVLAEMPVLAEMYGRGVHAYYSGNHTDAYNLLSMAINNGSKDPRAYYFRGIVADASGRGYEAEADWQRGAELEAASGRNPTVGRALARFQGATRLKLEGIRQKARLQALALAAARSQARYGEINAAQPTGNMMMAPPAAAAVTPPPVPPADFENPFDKEQDQLAAGEPKVESDDALKGAEDPFSNDAPAADAPAGGADDPFATPAGGGGAPAADPFAEPAGGAAPAPAADDPFATPAADDPFATPAGDEPAMDDPFAN